MRIGGALAFGLLAIACTTTQPPPPAKPEPVAPSAIGPRASASAGSPAPAKIDTSSWAKDWPKTWSDPRVVDALAQKCDYVPEERPPGRGESTPADMFRCTIAHHQSCNPDYCFGAGDQCEHDCTTSCLDCGGACAKTCASCKSECNDASCTHKCAETCAQCKESCEGKLDHCNSAECGKKHADCEKKIQASWKRSGCSAKCTRYQSCMPLCDKARDPEKCRETCEAQLAPGWKACYDKCEALRLANKDDESTACLGACYETVTCAPFICQLGGVREPEPDYGPIKPKASHH